VEKERRSLSKLSALEKNVLIEQYRYRRTVDRLYYISLVLGSLFAIYGFTSFDFIHEFRKDISITANVWPRLVLNSVPMLFLAGYLKRSTAEPFRKIQVWITLFCLVYDLACMIWVWPIAWKGQPSIMLYVNTINTTTFFAVAMMLGLKPLEAIYPILAVGLLFWTPLFYVVQHAGNATILKTVLSDTLFLGGAGFMFGSGFEKAESQIANLELSKNI
jgi:hypothetical protein